MSKNDKKGELSLPVIKIHHKAIVINAVVIESGVNKYNNGTEWKAYLYGNLTYMLLCIVGRTYCSISGAVTMCYLFGKRQ